MKPTSQEELEKLMVSLGIQRYDQAVDYALQRKDITTVRHGRQLLEHIVGAVENALTTWLSNAKGRAGRRHHAYKYLSKLDPALVSLIASKVCIDTALLDSKEERQFAYAIGAALEDEAYLREFKRKAAALWKGVMREQKHDNAKHKRACLKAAARRMNLEWDNWPMKDKIVVGLVLLDLIYEHTILLDRKNITSYKRGALKNVVHVSISKDTTEWLKDAQDKHALMLPVYLPCVDPPIYWENNWDGGYYGYGLSRKGLMYAREGLRHLLDDFNVTTQPAIFRAVNATQSVPWRINEKVYEVARYFWDLGTPVAGFPSADDESLPALPPDAKTNPIALKQWKKLAHLVYTRNATRSGKRLLTDKILSTAELFSDTGVNLYFPQKLDFRGRMYPVPNFLEPQGCDLAKGLLEFSTGKEVTERGRWWLAVHGANLYGYDKGTLEERVAFIKGHETLIRECAENPLDCLWWSEADKPWQFLAFCFAWLDEDSTHLPLAIDGSNNGLQIFSLMLRDPVGGAATNVVPGDRPRDIYQDIADNVTLDLMTINKEWAYQWREHLIEGLPRKAVKRPTMTMPYGCKRVSCRDYVREWYLDSVGGVRGDDPLLPSVFSLADVVWNAIPKVVPCAVEAMEWLQGVARTIAKLGHPIIWTTPIGLEVGQIYYKPESVIVRTVLGGSVKRQCTVAIDSKNIDTAKMANGISPNVVHSLDATAMFMTINKLLDKGIEDFSMVHDSFSVHACNMDELAKATRESYATLFSGNYLMDLKKSFERRYGIELPDPPKQGDLKPRDLLDSIYFFQ